MAKQGNSIWMPMINWKIAPMMAIWFSNMWMPLWPLENDIQKAPPLMREKRCFLLFFKFIQPDQGMLQSISL